MRLFAYEGGLGAVVVRLALLVFVMRGGREGGLTEGLVLEMKSSSSEIWA